MPFDHEFAVENIVNGDSRMLNGVRVAELHVGPGPVSVRYAGSILARLGAHVDVLVIESDRSPARAVPATDRWFEAFLAVGKHSVIAGSGRPEWTVEEAIGQLRASPTNVVLVGHNGRERDAVDRLLAAFRDGLPDVHVVSITPFGLTGPKSRWTGSNLVALAAGGSAYYQPAGVIDSNHERPLQISQYAADLVAGASAAVAAVATQSIPAPAPGSLSDLSVHEAVLAMSLLNSSWVTHTGSTPARSAAAGRRGASLGLLLCADGRFSLLPVHESQWERWVGVMGNPEWAASPLFATRDARSSHMDALQHLIEEWARNFTKNEIWQMGQSANVPVFPVHTPLEVVADPQMAERAFFEPLAAPGAEILMAPVPGSPFKHIELLPEAAGSSPGTTARSSREPGQIKVLDLSWVLAGPHATTWLGYLGADVIRVESARRLDQFRANPPFRGSDRDPNQAGGFQHINQNKRSVAVDLSHPSARDLVLQLAEHADVLIENFGAGQMERFGLSEHALRQRQPNLIIASSSGLGRTGPGANMRAYGQTIHAYAGMAGRVGYCPDDLRGIAGTWADPLTGVFQAIAITAAIRRQRITGGGANIDLSMAECAIFGVIPDVFVDAAAGQLDDELPENKSRMHILNDVFRCRGSESWIAISIESRDEEATLRSVLGIGADEDLPGRTAIELVTRHCDASELASRLQQAGIAAHRVNDAAQALTDPHALRRGMTAFMADPSVPYLVATMPWRRIHGGEEQEWPLRPAPRLGEHTADVLREWLGMSAKEIESLTDMGVLR